MAGENKFDKFYTLDNVANNCVELVDKYLNFSNQDIFIEPSAGAGVFIDTINKFYNSKRKIEGFDLVPDRNDIKQQDFLTLDLKQFQEKNIHFIGNPPFGRSSKLCRLFIKHMCKHKKTKSISLILPISYHKSFNQRTSFSNQFHLIHEVILEKNSFQNRVENFKVFDVPAVFQIWERKDYPRVPYKNIIPKGFKYIPNINGLDADFAVCAKGHVAGKIVKVDSKNTLGPVINSSSYRFIKLDKPISDIFDIYNKIAFEGFKFYDMGSPTLNKQEINVEINKCIEYSNTLKTFNIFILICTYMIYTKMI